MDRIIDTLPPSQGALKSIIGDLVTKLHAYQCHILSWEISAGVNEIPRLYLTIASPVYRSGLNDIVMHHCHGSGLMVAEFKVRQDNGHVLYDIVAYFDSIAHDKVDDLYLDELENPLL